MSRRPTAPTTSNGPTTLRCAIYTRKSSEEGLDMEFNSLDAQRESGEAYIASLKGEGWVCLPDRYDDGGFTGGNMERPAVKRLMADIESGKVDCVVVYKVDRLSRSLMDFARMMEVFERKKIAFVSVTQQFNTVNSMGRLTLNILLSFAQFEREIISERTRDKIAAARRKGKWSGGRWVLGYSVDSTTRRLVVNPPEAELVREIFQMYRDGKTLLQVAAELNARGLRTKRVTTPKGKVYGGIPWDKSNVLKVLSHVLYVGKVSHHENIYPGEHAAIVDEAVWTAVQQRLRANGRDGGSQIRNKHNALLKGLLRCGPCGVAMGHTYATKGGKRIYRYYACQRAQKQGYQVCPCRSVPAEEVEKFVVDQIKVIGKDPNIMSATLAKLREQSEEAVIAAKEELRILERELREVGEELKKASGASATNAHAAARLPGLHEQLEFRTRKAGETRALIRDLEERQIGKLEVDACLARFERVWGALTPNEQARLLRTLLQRVEYDATKGSIGITFHPLGLRSIGQYAHGLEEKA